MCGPRALLRWIDGHLTPKRSIPPVSARNNAARHVLGPNACACTWSGPPASPDELQRLRDWCGAPQAEPVQYLVGERGFWSKRFKVGPATLVPRPATEHVVEECITAARAAAAAGAIRCACWRSARDRMHRGLHRRGHEAAAAGAPVGSGDDLVPAAWSWRGETRRHAMQDSIEFRAARS